MRRPVSARFASIPTPRSRAAATPEAQGSTTRAPFADRRPRPGPSRTADGPGGLEVDLGAALEARGLAPFLRRMRTHTRRAVEHGRDAAVREQRRIRPERDPEEAAVAGRARYLLRELVARIDPERLATEGDVRRGTRAVDEGLQLALDVGDRLARQRPPLARPPAPLPLARGLLPAFDPRRVGGRRPEQLVERPALKTVGKLREPRQHRRHRRDRVDAEIRSRAVSCAAARLDLEAGEPLVRDADAFVGRLAHDRGV